MIYRFVVFQSVQLVGTQDLAAKVSGISHQSELGEDGTVVTYAELAASIRKRLLVDDLSNHQACRGEHHQSSLPDRWISRTFCVQWKSRLKKGFR